jgi:GNAT superfamily N-acetyltransferase
MLTRRASLADAGAIGALQLRAWWRNYQDIVGGEHLIDEDEESRAAEWTQVLALGLTETFVAELAGAVHGFATVGPGREDGGGAEGELYALYVAPVAQGAGVGTALLAEAEQALRAAGHTTAVLRVLELNGLARTFYERHGWALVPGAETPHPWGTHVLYRRAL